MRSFIKSWRATGLDSSITTIHNLFICSSYITNEISHANNYITHQSPLRIYLFFLYIEDSNSHTDTRICFMVVSSTPSNYLMDVVCHVHMQKLVHPCHLLTYLCPLPADDSWMLVFVDGQKGKEHFFYLLMRVFPIEYLSHIPV